MLIKECYKFCQWSFLYSYLKLVMTGNEGIYQNSHLKWAQLPPPTPNPNAHLEPEQLWGLKPFLTTNMGQLYCIYITDKCNSCKIDVF